MPKKREIEQDQIERREVEQREIDQNRDIAEVATEQDGPSALALPGTAIVSWLSDLAENTRQWGQYAQEKLIEGDQAEASKALVTMNTQIEELQRHAGLTQAVVGGLVDSVKTVVAQRDELVHEVENLKDEMEWIEERAFEDGASMAEEHVYDEIYEDPSIVGDAVDEAREKNFHYLVGQLRRVGNESAAQLLESRYAEAKANREELARIENDARVWYFTLPVEARIGSPTLEEDEVDNGLMYDEDEFNEDEADS